MPTAHKQTRKTTKSPAQSIDILHGDSFAEIPWLVHGFSTAGVPRFEIAHYSEHALGAGEEAAAIAYIQIKHGDGRTRWGAGVDTNIELASVKAVLSALNRS